MNPEPNTQPPAIPPLSSSDLLGDRVWNRSIREEIISALWLISGLLAWQGGIKWLAWLLFVKSVSDMLAAIVFAIIEVTDRRNPASPGVIGSTL